MKETARHREAFEFYYALGEKRGLRETAQRFNVSLTSIAKWSTAFGWQDRVEYRDKEIADAIEKKRIAQYKKDKDHFYLLLQKMVHKFQGKLLKDEIKIDSVGDYEKMMKIAAGLNGESFDVQLNTNITVSVPESDEDDGD